MREARLAYIKLVPLIPEEIQAVQADRTRKDNRRLFAHNDAHRFHYLYAPKAVD